MGVDSWSVTARPWKLPSLNFCQHWNSINQISKLFEHFFQSSVMIVDDRTKGGFSALIWKELGNNGHHPELHSRKLCQKDSWKSSWNSLKGRNIFKFPIKNYVFCIFFASQAWLSNKHGPRGPRPLQSEASYEKVPPFSRPSESLVWEAPKVARWTERFHWKIRQSNKKTQEIPEVGPFFFS